MEFVPRVCVDVMMAGPAQCVTKDPVTLDVMTMDSARTALVCARKDGMANIVLCVSFIAITG